MDALHQPLSGFTLVRLPQLPSFVRKAVSVLTSWVVIWIPAVEKTQ
jgi:hypothetical protein